MNETTITIDGLECFIQETTALEAWFVMHGLRQVLCGWTDDDPKKGHLAFVVEQPLEPKEIAFINEQASIGGMPPLEEFLAISGLVGVTDFRVVESTARRIPPSCPTRAGCSTENSSRRRQSSSLEMIPAAPPPRPVALPVPSGAPPAAPPADPVAE